MTDKKNTILQVNTIAHRGGAARIVSTLHQTYRSRGLNSWVAVGHKIGDNPYELPLLPRMPDNPLYQLVYRALHKSDQTISPHLPTIKGHNPGHIFRYLAELPHTLIPMSGQEDFQWAGTKGLLIMTPTAPDILHIHNMHGDYFDLRQLPQLTQQIPAIITLHDAWTFTGHCAHFVDCDRWQTGCGNCPDLTRYPVLNRDGTAFNYRRKQKIYRSSHYWVVAPSRWLIENAQQSILAEGAVDFRVIPNGIDLGIFFPTDKAQSRQQLGLPQDAIILLYIVASALQDDPYKDYAAIKTAIEQIKQIAPNQKIHFIGIGGESPIERYNNLTLQFLPYQADPRVVSQYYQAADIFLHAARADTYPTTILEAQACGTPVIATAIGGIPEQLVDDQTGYLVPGGDGEAMAAKIQQMITTPGQLQAFSIQAAEYARQNFGVSHMVDGYLALYDEMLENWRTHTD